MIKLLKTSEREEITLSEGREISRWTEKFDLFNAIISRRFLKKKFVAATQKTKKSPKLFIKSDVVGES
jgi:hypothetical protein